MRIAEPLRLPGGEAGVDLWPTLDALKNVPALILRGALSDLFSAQTAQQMLARLAQAELVVVSDVGHAPVLDEQEAAAGDRRSVVEGTSVAVRVEFGGTPYRKKTNTKQES